MIEWLEVEASEFCSSVRDGTHASPKESKAGRKLITSKHLNGCRLDLANAYLISESDFEEVNRRSKVDQWDVLISMIGTVGEVYLEKGDPEYAIKNMGLFKSKSEELGRWLYYYLQSPEAKAELNARCRGTTQKYVPLGELRKFPVKVPQQATIRDQISSLLSALDDKIELNRRMNETLEEMARALFRDWFVDFGPTRRQMEGATDPATIMGQAFPPEKAATLAPLFPTKLGDDGLPEGWDEQPFEALVEIVGGGTPKTKVAEYWGGDIPWFSVVDAPTQGAVYVHSTEKSITTAGLENSSARMVPEGTTIISARGTVGKIGMAPGDMTFNQSCYALRPKKPVGERFIFLATGQLVERLKAMAHGSVFSTITRNTFSSLSFAGAGEPCYTAFEEIIAPLFAKIKANGQENQTLAEMRDLLLPKLMSGEIRLKDAKVVQLSEVAKPTPDFATDLLGNQFLSPEQKEERDAVIVAATVKALQKDNLLVGNVRVMKGVYLLKRKQALSLSGFQREAAGPYDRAFNHEIRGSARERSWIRETKKINAQGSRIPGNQPASKYSEVEPLIAKYDLGDAVDWLARHFKGESMEWMECVATVDVAKQELERKGLEVTVANIKSDIASDPKWKPKLEKNHFTDIEIRRAVKKLGEIF
ncbi:restriction endonuclease subunit S [Halocynthiibacter sp.]|uniref:restriction endonuclease subunit S n=1 Tax=Halocynthiibacter sp. TaxID=1979210 RepID=UPI003C58BDB1